MQKNALTANILWTLTPILVLILIMMANIIIFKDGATSGPNQLALLGASLLATLIGVFKLKTPYKQIEKGITKSIDAAMISCIILLVIGSVIGIWILSGVVPTLIYYGFKIINPAIFLPVACIACAIVSMATGSSWTTTGTIGLALLAIGKTFGIPDGMIAGAIISGAYFGDKMSPLSDTTNLAPAMAGSDLFEHIRHMLYTSGPSIVLAIIGFSILGVFYHGAESNLENIDVVASSITQNFTVGWYMLLVPAITLFMVSKKLPAIPSLCTAILLGVLATLLFQQEMLLRLTNNQLTLKSGYEVIMNVLVSGFKLESGNSVIDSLFSRGGMSSMLNTVWLIITAMIFGGVLDATGMLERLAQAVLTLVRGTGSLVGATIASCIVTNITASDQYIAIVLPGRMFRRAYQKWGLQPKNLSRALEDGATATSPLIPWNSCGAYESSVLGVSTLTYMPYCFFNILSPIIGTFVAAMNWSMTKVVEEAQENEHNQLADSY